MLRGHQPTGQRGAKVHPEDREPGLRRPLHRGDVPQVDRLRALPLLLQRLDMSRLRYRLCKFTIFHLLMGFFWTKLLMKPC